MKKIIYLMIAMFSFVSCSDETEEFIVDLSAEALQFTPTMGGAILKYKLPADPDIVAINIRYNDAYGNPVLKSGSSATNQLTITGFNEEKTAVPAQVSFLKRNNEESQPVDVVFSTLDSAPICFINGAEFKSGWDGCTLEYENPEGTTGMAHVFYLGTNPLDNQNDTVWIESFPLAEGKDIRHYTPKPTRMSHTLIVRVEDYRGFIVKERVWEDIHAFNVEKLDPTKFELIYNNSLEVPEEKLGLQYLTDGDTKGSAWFQTQEKYQYYTFVSKENGVGETSEPMYIDLKKMRPISEIRFYAYRHISKKTGIGTPKPFMDWGSPTTTSSAYQAPLIFKSYLTNKLPSSVTVYGCRVDEENSNWDEMVWEEICSFHDDADLDQSERWTYHAVSCGGTSNKNYRFDTLEAIEAADPIYKSMPVDINIQGEGFRYLKIKFNETYLMPEGYEQASITNTIKKHLTFHELELYSDKD